MKKTLPVIIIIALAGIAIYLGYNLQNQDDLSADDSSALYGGVAESGYLSAGYVITETDASTKTCGFSVLDSNTAITAAHCVDDATKMYIGKEKYQNSRTNDVQVIRAIQKDSWVRSQNRSDDFAVLYYSEPGYFENFAQISEPEEGCNLRVVAYGRTEDPNDPPMLRKSARLCAFDIDRSTFKVKGAENAGICFGDSGSPVYIEGTNQVVGVIASIVNEVPNDPAPCAFGNTAIVVRADANENIISETGVTDTLAQTGGVGISREFTIAVANETFFEKIGLAQEWENLDDRKKYSYGLYFTGGLLVVSSIYLVYQVAGSLSNQVSNKKTLQSKSGII